MSGEENVLPPSEWNRIAPREPAAWTWLVERGQTEGQVPTVWWSTADADWTTDANRATRFSSRAAAEAFIEEASAIPSYVPRFGRAVEHGWIGSDSDLATRHDRWPEPPL